MLLAIGKSLIARDCCQGNGGFLPTDVPKLPRIQKSGNKRTLSLKGPLLSAVVALAAPAGGGGVLAGGRGGGGGVLAVGRAGGGLFVMGSWKGSRAGARG